MIAFIALYLFHSKKYEQGQVILSLTGSLRSFCNSSYVKHNCLSGTNLNIISCMLSYITYIKLKDAPNK